MTDEPMRPDPDRLLEQTAEAHRGKLKIFFGACAGVGKTFAMLTEAQRLRAQGLDILIGVVETHGRKETAAMLEGLSTLPQRRLSHRGRYVKEFDLDGALARRPALILVDELAHSNAPGSRHPKRWQDVEELLEAGIDVFTTVNVQHLESLNDVVSGITGVQVRETVPDPFFDAADDVVLVDLPPDDLRQRLNEGKVYIGGQAERAIENFFRKGNLIALRELALRRIERGVEKKRGHAYDPVHGRPDFMRHVGEESTLGDVGCFRRLLGQDQLRRPLLNHLFKMMTIAHQLDCRFFLLGNVDGKAGHIHRHAR